MLNDWPVTGERIDESFHSDVNEDIYALEKDHKESYSAVRKVDQVVVGAGEKQGVKTYIFTPPLICKSSPTKQDTGLCGREGIYIC